jgi:hypothetical protein
MRCSDGHTLWVNSKALALAGITKNTPDPDGFIVRDLRTGEPSGVLKEEPATTLIYNVVPKPTQSEQRRALRAASEEALRYGVTSVTEAAGSPEDLKVFEDARRSGNLTVRVDYTFVVRPGFSAAEADRFDNERRRHSDTPFLKTGLLKMFMDGVIESNTAFLLDNYNNVPSPGKPNFAVDDFKRILEMMDRRRWQFMIHSIGDGAVRMTLDGYEHLAKVSPAPARGRRNRIEHIETIDPADVPRFGRLGVIASMHPPGLLRPGDVPPTQPSGPDISSTNLGPERAARVGMWKSISGGGGRVLIGSDWPVSSLDAMGRIYTITHRGTSQIDRRLSLTSAIDSYTREGAYASFDEMQKGIIAPDKLADIVILATDVFTREPMTKDDIAVKITILDGKIVYRADR